MDQAHIVQNKLSVTCTCDHDAEFLVQENTERRSFQKYITNADGEYVLICVYCSALWDHRATDRVIDRIMGGAS